MRASHGVSHCSAVTYLLGHRLVTRAILAVVALTTSLVAVGATTTSSASPAGLVPLVANNIYTIAGDGSTANTYGGQASSSGVHGPEGSVSDAAGNLYIVTDGNMLDEVAAATGTQWGQSMTAGNLYRIAGQPGVTGHSGDGGAATSSYLDGPNDVALDASGDLYIADTANNRIQEIAATTHSQWGQSMTANDVYTIAGSSSGTSGHSGDGGAATSALLSSPYGLAFDAAGDLYVGDYSNNRIQEVAATTHSQWSQSMTANDIYTVAGSSSGTSGHTGDGGAATSATLYGPAGVATDAAGDLYFAEYNNNRVQEVAAVTGTQWGQSMTAGDIYTVAGSSSGTWGQSGDGGVATSALLGGPDGITMDSSGNLYIGDFSNNRIQEVAAATGTQWGQSMTAGDIYTVAGSASGTAGSSGDGAAATSALLAGAAGVTLDPHGDLVIDDQANSEVREVPNGSNPPIFSGATSGVVASSALFGASNPAEPGVTQGIATVGAGVNPSTGDVSVTAMDASATTYGPALSVTRTYDAGLAQEESGSSSPGPFGYGWSFTPSLNTSTLTVTQSSGAQVSFVAPTSGACSAPYVGTGTSGTYCALPYVTATLTLSGSTYTFTTHPYTAYTFNSTGKLTSETGPGGSALTWTYGSPSPGSGHCPSAANSCNTETAASGRTLVLGLNSSGLITTVTDPSGNTWTYAYSSSNLTSVTDPLSRVTSYTYDTSNSNSVLQHDLLTLTKPDGQSGGSHAGTDLLNAYNSAGQVTSQIDPMSRATSYNYVSMNEAIGSGDVVVTDPDGNVDEYFFKTRILDETIVGYGSALASTSAFNPSAMTLLRGSSINPDGATTTYGYDADGNLTSTTNALGQITTNSYNAFDEPVCVTTPMSASGCSSLSPPAAVFPGASVTPPSSAPPAYVTYSLYDTSGNQLWTTMGVYPPGGSSPSYSRTSYSLYQGNSVTLSGTLDQCGATPPSTSLPCATINADQYVTQLGYNTSGDVTSSSTPDGNPSETANTTNGYDSDGNKTSTTSPLGNLSGANTANYTTAYSFDADREPTVSVLAGGSGATTASVTKATYFDADGNAVATIAPGGNPYSTGNTSGCNPLTTSTCADTTYTGFDADDESTLVTDPMSNQTLTCYDGDGNIAQTIPPSGVSSSSLTASSCPASYPSDYGSGHALSSDATTNTYNAQGDKTVVTVPPATGSNTQATTTNVYDAAGRLVEVDAPPSTTSGGSNVITTSTYDLVGNLSTQTLSSGSSSSTTSSCYDPAGDTTATVPGVGNASGVVACQTTSPWGTSSPYQTSSSYDSAGEEVSTTSPAPGSGSAATTSYTYDAQGNQLTMTDPSSHVTTYTYNPLNQHVSQVTSSGGSSLVSTDYLDAEGDEIAVTSPGGNPYSVTNTSGCNPITTSTCAYTTYKTYNSSGQLLTSTNPDGETTTNYYSTTTGNLVATTGPSGNPATCNPTTSSTLCADTTTDSYNSLNQLTCTTEPNTTSNTCSSPGSYAGIVKYTYTSDGLRATMTDVTGQTSYTYDTSDRLVSSTNGAGAVVTYAYGQNSDPTCVSYPNASNNTCTSPGSGVGVVNYTYNSSNQLATITDWAGNTFAYSYNATGQPTNLSVNSGAVGVATSYDNAGNVSSVNATASSGSTALLNLSVTRNQNGQIATEAPTVGSTAMATDSFGYNASNQVTSGPITGVTGSTGYSYTPDGGVNQDTNTVANSSYDTSDVLCWTSATASSNPCATTPSGGTTYGYNSDGERTSMTPATGNSAAYKWDSPTGDLICANTNGATCSTSSPTSSTTLYAYSGDGLRTRSTISSTTTNYTWGNVGSNPVNLNDGTWDYVYVPGSSLPVEQVAATGSSPAGDLLVSDPNGSVRGIVQLTSGTHQNQLVNYTDYDAYGNPITQSGGSVEAGGLTATHSAINANYVATSAFGFGSGYTDPTGLIYLVHRYYDPATGQFLSIDPNLSTTNQAYQYAGDDPINSSDPSGLYSYDYNEYIGTSALGTAVHVMDIFKFFVHNVFPFPISYCAFGPGASCLLQPLHFPCQVPMACGWVTVTGWTSTSFTFTVNYSGFDPVGSTIQFVVHQGYLFHPNDIWLEQRANAPHASALANFFVWIGVARQTWNAQASNLTNAVRFVNYLSGYVSPFGPGLV